MGSSGSSMTMSPVWGEGYLRELIDLPEADLVACATKHRAARTSSSGYGIESLYLDYLEMVEKERLDAVLMALPNDEKADAMNSSQETGSTF